MEHGYSKKRELTVNGISLKTNNRILENLREIVLEDLNNKSYKLQHTLCNRVKL
jgi:predicted RNA-binding protein Jag